MTDELDDLSPLAKRLMDAERKRPDEGAAVQDRLLARVTASVAVGAAGVAAGAKIASGAASSTATATATTSAAGAAGLTAKAVPWIVAAFVAGGGAGAAIHASVATAPAPIVVASSAPPRPTEPSAPPPASTTPVVTPNDLRDLPPSTPPPSTAAPRPSTTASASASDTDLAAERALVDRARSALAAGQPAAAIDAVDAHAARFPKGRLTEEREALAVQALARAGHTAAAKARAAAFRKAYPTSLFTPAVDLAVP